MVKVWLVPDEVVKGILLCSLFVEWVAAENLTKLNDSTGTSVSTCKISP